MMQQSGYVAVEQASRYMVRLCYHFSKKIAVEHDETRGVAHFPWGSCTLTALEGGIEFVCEAVSHEQLERVRHVIDAHVSLFARRAPLQLQWGSPMRC